MKKIIYLIPLISILFLTNCNNDKLTSLCFTSQQNKSTLNYETVDTWDPLSIDIETSKDEKTWTDWTEDTTITLNKGEKIYVRNTKNTLSKSFQSFFNFKMDGRIAASGNVNSMINYGELYDHCYFYLFYQCDALTEAPSLPSLALAPSCYESMFDCCTRLTSAPELPATALVEDCYLSMFMSCIHLTKAPVLPATTLAEGCYSRMFENCFDLPAAPKLPATTLAKDCYQKMFYGCEDYLTKAPELPATTLVEGCYHKMFADCKNLNYVKVGFGDVANWPEAEDCTAGWLDGVSAIGTFAWRGNLDGPSTRSIDTVPEGWTIETH